VTTDGRHDRIPPDTGLADRDHGEDFMLKTMASTAAAILFIAALAMAERARTMDVYTDAVLPDGQELKAGKYQVMVDEGEKEVQFLQAKKVVARHPCQCMGHEGEKNRYNQVRYNETAGKKQKLTEIRFAGKSCTLNLDVQQGM
jgi:hypothetical protein